MGLYNLLLIRSLLYQKFQVLNINKSSRCSRILIKAQKKKKKKKTNKKSMNRGPIIAIDLVLKPIEHDQPNK